MADDKWYSHGLTADDVGGLRQRYAKITNPRFGDHLEAGFGLALALVYDQGTRVNPILTDMDDIQRLLQLTGAMTVDRLEGKVIEAYVQGLQLKGLGVNEHLV